jgi:hypothetical protein
MGRTNEGAWYTSRETRTREAAVEWARMILASVWINHVSLVEVTDGTGAKPAPSKED